MLTRKLLLLALLNPSLWGMNSESEGMDPKFKKNNSYMIFKVTQYNKDFYFKLPKGDRESLYFKEFTLDKWSEFSEGQKEITVLKCNEAEEKADRSIVIPQEDDSSEYEKLVFSDMASCKVQDATVQQHDSRSSIGSENNQKNNNYVNQYTSNNNPELSIFLASLENKDETKNDTPSFSWKSILNNIWYGKDITAEAYIANNGHYFLVKKYYNLKDPSITLMSKENKKKSVYTVKVGEETYDNAVTIITVNSTKGTLIKCNVKFGENEESEAFTKIFPSSTKDYTARYVALGAVALTALGALCSYLALNKSPVKV